MRSPTPLNAHTLAVTAVSIAALARPCLAQSAAADPRAGDITVRIGAAGVLFQPNASFNLGGARVPGANLRLSDAVTVSGEASYFISPVIALGVGFGLPPVTTLNGTGPLAPLGEIARLRYGSVASTLQYHVPGLGRFKPWFGAGAAYFFISSTTSEAIGNVHVNNQWGPAVQGGADIALIRGWSLFGSLTQIFLHTDSTGTLGPTPVTSKITANPLIVQVGVAQRF